MKNYLILSQNYCGYLVSLKVFISKTISEMMKFMFNMIWQNLEGKNLPDARAIEEARKVQLK